MPLVRYLDDYALFCRDWAEAEAAARDLEGLAASAGLPLKAQVGPSGEPVRCRVADLGAGDRAEWLGYSVGLGPDGGLTAGVAERAWDGLRAGLADARRRPDRFSHAAVTRGWAAYLGPCRLSLGEAFFARLRGELTRAGFGGLFDRKAVEEELDRGHSRLQALLGPGRTDPVPAATAQSGRDGPSPVWDVVPPEEDGRHQPGKDSPLRRTDEGCSTTVPPVTDFDEGPAVRPGASPDGAADVPPPAAETAAGHSPPATTSGLPRCPGEFRPTRARCRDRPRRTRKRAQPSGGERPPTAGARPTDRPRPRPGPPPPG